MKPSNKDSSEKLTGATRSPNEPKPAQQGQKHKQHKVPNKITSKGNNGFKYNQTWAKYQKKEGALVTNQSEQRAFKIAPQWLLQRAREYWPRWFKRTPSGKQGLLKPVWRQIKRWDEAPRTSWRYGWRIGAAALQSAITSQTSMTHAG